MRRAAAIGGLLAAIGGAADGQPIVTLTGGELTRLCAEAARSETLLAGSERFCTAALQHDDNVGRGLAGVYVNRGVLRMRGQALSSANADFETALSIDASLGEAWVNRGAARLAAGRWSDGLSDLDHGLALSPEEPEKAFYNRGLARERLNDLPGAYADYSEAARLAPSWSAPQVELQRFHVVAPSDPGRTTAPASRP
jgi:tetratricopeptide (TPR) repeat protein